MTAMSGRTARRTDRLFGASLVALDWAAGGFAAWLVVGWWRSGEISHDRLLLVALGAVAAALARTVLVVPAIRYRPGTRRRSR